MLMVKRLALLTAALVALGGMGGGGETKSEEETKARTTAHGLYKRRGAVEREFGRLKNEWALTPLRVRGVERVRLHANLTILAKLSCALARARAVPLAA
jgi:transposase